MDPTINASRLAIGDDRIQNPATWAAVLVWVVLFKRTDWWDPLPLLTLPTAHDTLDRPTVVQIFGRLLEGDCVFFSLQDGAKTCQDDPKTSQDAPRPPQDGPHFRR